MNFKNEIFKNSLIIIIFFCVSFFLAKLNVPPEIEIQKEHKINYILYPETDSNLYNSTVIYVWATWCSVCKVNSVPVEWNYRISKIFGINFISLEEGENIDELNNYLKVNSLIYPVGLLDKELSDEFDIKEYPSYIYIKKNKILLKDTGIVNPVSFLMRILYMGIHL